MESQTKSSRRGFIWGAAAAGAAATAAVTLPRVDTPVPPEASKTEPAPERGGGYRLSEHVKQYYKTTLI